MKIDPDLQDAIDRLKEDYPNCTVEVPEKGSAVRITGPIADLFEPHDILWGSAVEEVYRDKQEGDRLKVTAILC